MGHTALRHSCRGLDRAWLPARIGGGMFQKILRGVGGAAVVLGILFVQATGVLASSTGQITGRINDATTNSPIAGAAITAVSPSGIYKAVSGANGYYAIVNVYPDTYRLTATASGYQTNTSD